MLINVRGLIQTVALVLKTGEPIMVPGERQDVIDDWRRRRLKPNKPEYFESSNLTVITVFHNDELNETDKSNLYRDVWKWFKDRCIPPKGLIID